ncbi:hypothetical protein D9M71_838190 [compost metagenome]
MAHNTLNEVSSHIIALAHPNPHTVAFVFQHESAPIPIVQIHDIAETGLARQSVKRGGARRMHKELTLAVPDLERDFAFVRMSVDSGYGFA